MALQAEVIEFLIPSENNKTLFVWNLQPCLSDAEIYNCLCSTFSEFGLLYSLRVCENASQAEPGYYAVVKFFSAVDASRAQSATDGKTLFQHSPVKVRLCTKLNERGFHYRSYTLNSTKCQELANYYLGFNGWTKQIILLQNISGTEQLEDEEAKLLPSRNLKFLCVVEINFRNHAVHSRGVGVAEEDLENNKDPTEYIMKLRKVQKFAVQKAVSDAFQKVLLIILGE
ncbi:RAD52 motif-containing protein 1 [Protopterus annectens]|uniref:RAD52 motif-containing protein 1 n=1 Tax=Protopterus annectens TaxID=7888 RepID=UPI001CF997F5|nr:RAD52 motif-containing protein 1 [Protopterus annectens]